MEAKPDGRWFVNVFNPEDKIFVRYNDAEPAWKDVGTCETCGKTRFAMRSNALIRPERYMEEVPLDGCVCYGS